MADSLELLESLGTALLGETFARARYESYAKTAGKEGYQEISSAFAEIALQEVQHAKQLTKMIDRLGGIPSVILSRAVLPIESLTTAEALRVAIAGEEGEAEEFYPAIAKRLEEADLSSFAAQILAIAAAEEHHADRFRWLSKQLDAGELFSGQAPWVCRKCGFRVEDGAAPEVCPSCNHPQGWFERSSGKVTSRAAEEEVMARKVEKEASQRMTSRHDELKKRVTVREEKAGAPKDDNFSSPLIEEPASI